MALTTAQINSHIVAMLKTVTDIQDIKRLIPIAVAYAKTGVDEKEAMRAMLKFIVNNILKIDIDSSPNAWHRFQHWLDDVGGERIF